MTASSNLDRLVEIGRRRGGLKVEDIEAALPLDAMDVDELARMLARLEEAGVSVEIDPALLKDRRDSAPPLATPDVLPEGKKPVPPEKYEMLAKSIKEARVASTTLKSSPVMIPPTPVGKAASRYVLAGAGLAVLLIVAIWLIV